MPLSRGELLTDLSSWTMLMHYLDAAAWIGVPAAWPPRGPRPPGGTNFGQLAADALYASRLGLPGRRGVRVAACLVMAKEWLHDSGHGAHLREEGPRLLDRATVYARAMCAPAITATVLDILDPAPLHTAAARWRRRHPIRARRRSPQPHVLDVTSWQESLWWQRVDHPEAAHDEPISATAPLVHAATAIATAVWAWPNAVRDPIGIRTELRNRIIRARAWAASGELGP